jgi:hypothetical protein
VELETMCAGGGQGIAVIVEVAQLNTSDCDGKAPLAMSETTAVSRAATATIARIRELTGKLRATVGWPAQFGRLTLAVVQNPTLAPGGTT